MLSSESDFRLSERAEGKQDDRPATGVEEALELYVITTRCISCSSYNSCYSPLVASRSSEGGAQSNMPPTAASVDRQAIVASVIFPVSI